MSLIAVRGPTPVIPATRKQQNRELQASRSSAERLNQSKGTNKNPKPTKNKLKRSLVLGPQRRFRAKERPRRGQSEGLVR